MSLDRELEHELNSLRILGGEPPVHLDDSVLAALACIVLRDLDEELPTWCLSCEQVLEKDFYDIPISDVRCDGCPDLKSAYARFMREIDEFPAYFKALVSLHKYRAKYRKILETQPIPDFATLEPRTLLEYGVTVREIERPSADALASWLVWRKFLYDLDNRSAQQAGYLFEPLIALAIGGVSFSAAKSPIRRSENKNLGRQVDCIKDKKAYEFKLRVTIAASGQGRWDEELQFPKDCKESGYIPVLVVLDATPSDKLKELSDAFIKAGGEVYVGTEAWDLLRREAGERLARFLEKYVRRPIEEASAAVDKMGAVIQPLRIAVRAEGDLRHADAVLPVDVYVGESRIPLR